MGAALIGEYWHSVAVSIEPSGCSNLCKLVWDARSEMLRMDGD